MTTELRTRLARAILMRLSLHAERQWTCDDLADAVLEVLASRSDADVERVARGMAAHDAVTDGYDSMILGWDDYTEEGQNEYRARARSAIRALVAGGSE